MRKNNKLVETVLLQFEADCFDAGISGYDRIRREYETSNKYAAQKDNKAVLHQLFHFMRAIDTALQIIVMEVHGFNTMQRAMGSYLSTLANSNKFKGVSLNHELKERYKKTVVNERNRIMHGACVVPSKCDRDKLLNASISLLQQALRCEK